MRKALALVVVLAGCSGTDKRPDTGVERMPVEADLPAYQGLKYEDGTCKRNAEFRTIRQVYRGDAKVTDVLAFYRKALPAHGWAEAPETGADAATLTFTKKSERCTITAATDSSNRAVVTVVVGYKG